MTDTAESLDPLRLPLTGERLIEASAGTGKTFTIAALYLRLLLGLGGESAFPRQVSVEELLVVTFTEAATEELRGRIRSNIHELRYSVLSCCRLACSAAARCRSNSSAFSLANVTPSALHTLCFNPLRFC